MPARRVLVTGLATYWGGRLAQALEKRPEIETIVGVDSREPTQELERTEFVRVSNSHSLLSRIVAAAEIDTVIDARLIVDPLVASNSMIHENNALGTLNILAACSAVQSPVQKLVFKSSAHYYGCDRDDPAFFTEDMGRDHGPRSQFERSILDAESAVGEFAERNREVTVTTLRFCNVLGPDLATSHARLLALPVVPMIAGFDPRYQFIHPSDVVAALQFAANHELPGTYNAAPDGVLVLSEVVGLLGKRSLPLLPPWGTRLPLTGLRPLGVRIPSEVLRQMRYGRAIDNRKLKAAGFDFRLSTRETVAKFGEYLRLRSVLERAEGAYQYEKEVEDFLRWSPSVRRDPAFEAPSGPRQPESRPKRDD